MGLSTGEVIKEPNTARTQTTLGIACFHMVRRNQWEMLGRLNQLVVTTQEGEL